MTLFNAETQSVLLISKEWCHVNRKQKRFLIFFQILCVNQITPFNDMGILLTKNIQRLMRFVTRRFDFYRVKLGAS